MNNENEPSNGEVGMTAYEPPAQHVTIFSEDPTKAIAHMENVVQAISKKCTGEQYISEIQDKKYPRVEWWTTVGAVLGLFPVVEYSRLLDREDEIVYEARVSVRRQGQVITSGEAICSSKEKAWGNRDEYAIKSMAQTRATGKAYRNGLAMIAKMAGLEGTPAEEMDSGSYSGPSKSKADDDKPWLNKTEYKSDKLTKEWKQVVARLKKHPEQLSKVFAHYKVNGENRKELESIVEAAKQPAVTGDDGADLDDTPF